MAEFERTAFVAADAQRVFRVLADQRETPAWAHGRLHLAGPGGDCQASVTGERMRVDWRSPSGYAEWAQVSPRDGGACVTLHVSLTGDLEPASPQDRAAVNEEIDAVLDGLCMRMEGGGS